MAYPQAPWTLQGYALQTLHLIDIKYIKPLIPSELKIIPILPGKTLGGVYLSCYGSGSMLAYSELIIIAAIVNHSGKIGGWISHIYVDNPDSIAGGREIWGLPKEMAEFTWKNGNHVTVRQDNQILCSLNYNSLGLAWRQWFGASSFSAKGANLLIFPAELESQFGLINSKLEIPEESSFRQLHLGQPIATVRCEQMLLRVGAPKIVSSFNLPIATG